MPELDRLLEGLEASRRKFANALKAYQAAGGRYINRARPLPQEIVDDCRFVADRYELLARLPKGGTAAEVGTDRGDFARRILEICAPDALHVFEIDPSRIDPANRQDPLWQQRCRIHAGDSASSLAKLPDAVFDWIYIDADHSYKGVRKDIAAAAPKVRAGGYLIFNDYCVWSVSSMRQCGVAQAVNEFAVATGYRFAFFAFQVTGYFDVALLKD